MRKFLLGAMVAGVATFGAVLPASAADDCAGSGSLGTDDCGGVIVEGGELIPTPQPVAPSPAAPTEPTATPTATPTPTVQPTQATLPVTGSETATLALAGIALIGGGAVMVTRTRNAA